MGRTRALWYEQVKAASEQLRALIAEQLLRLSVDEDNATFAVGDDHRVGRSIEQTEFSVAVA
jgi:hypothetical protein